MAKYLTATANKYAKVVNSYDSLGRLAFQKLNTVTADSTGVEDASTEKTLMNVTYGYKDISSTQTTNSVSQMTISTSGGYKNTLNYTYNAVGNIASASDSLNGKTTYVYDEAGQLKNKERNLFGSRHQVYGTI